VAEDLIAEVKQRQRRRYQRSAVVVSLVGALGALQVAITSSGSGPPPSGGWDRLAFQAGFSLVWERSPDDGSCKKSQLRGWNLNAFSQSLHHADMRC